MQFNSYIFILAFLPLTVAAYYLAGRLRSGLGKAVIIVSSLIFYGCCGWKMSCVLGISVLVNYGFALWIRRQPGKKAVLFLPVALNIGLLLLFKYTDFFLDNLYGWLGREYIWRNWMLPLGISFFTFQQIAYLTAVSRQEQVGGFADYLAFILYFPKILMGPLMDPVDFAAQLNGPDALRPDWEHMAQGVKIFCFGLFKKAVLADTFALAVAWGYDNLSKATSMDWFLILLFYSFEIYFDFSGYSDMAVGASRMLNITLPINFDSPYKAVSVRDFWKRWHISLTKFFTRYVYIPLGGSRRGVLLTCLNTMLVFLISGLWHGANWTFLLWGFLHGLLSLLDRLQERLRKPVFEPARWLLTFLTVGVLWLLFRSDSVGQWIGIVKNMMSLSDTAISAGLTRIFVIPEAKFLFDTIPFAARLNEKISHLMMLVFLAVSSFLVFFPENNYRNLKKLSFGDMLLAALALVWGITCLGGESVFVYFNF